jgi:hypothetical protein
MHARIALLGIALALASCRPQTAGPAADGAWDSFWIQPAGTKWDFDAAFANERGPAKRRAELRVSERTDRTFLEYDLFNPPDPGATASLDKVWYLSEGLVVWASNDSGEVTPLWPVFKLGARKGDRWSGPPGLGTVEHLGVEEIVVPAGPFSAVHIRVSGAEDAKTHDFWFAATEGLVRWSTRGPGGTADLVLRRYERGR